MEWMTNFVGVILVKIWAAINKLFKIEHELKTD